MCAVLPSCFVKVLVLAVGVANSNHPLCVPSLFSPLQGYITPLDFIWLKHLIPDILQNNKDLLFGNIRELYEFHNRYTIIHINRKKERKKESVSQADGICR